MKLTPAQTLPEILHIEPDVFSDDRGYFLETYQARKYEKHGISEMFVQDNSSFSKKDVLRGLHYQIGRPQGKLVYVVRGEIFDVAVDIRKGSPTFGRWVSYILSSENNHQIFIPDGFAHGFCVLSDIAHVMYKCTDFFDPASARGIIWNDTALQIEWPVEHPILSDKDKTYQSYLQKNFRHINH